MDWIKGIQSAIDYTEAHLTGEIDYDAAGEIGHRARVFAPNIIYYRSNALKIGLFMDLFVKCFHSQKNSILLQKVRNDEFLYLSKVILAHRDLADECTRNNTGPTLAIQ